jgi:prefoldin subunit 5
MTGEREAEDLQAQAKWLQEQLDAINQRVSELGQEA